MRISHVAIYQALYVQGCGALRRELTTCLRTARALRVPRARTRSQGKGFASPDILISARPAEVADRAVPGHWEGDLILGLGSSAIGTLVERTTHFTLLLHLPRMSTHGADARAKNGPALAGHGAEAVRDAIARTITVLPEQRRLSRTWDQGAEMAQHARLRIDTCASTSKFGSARFLVIGAVPPLSSAHLIFSMRRGARACSARCEARKTIAGHHASIHHQNPAEPNLPVLVQCPTPAGTDRLISP